MENPKDDISAVRDVYYAVSIFTNFKKKVEEKIIREEYGMTECQNEKIRFRAGVV